MPQQSKMLAAGLLLAFSGANIFAFACLFAGPVSLTGAMGDCGMEMPGTDGVAVGPAFNCCLSCVIEAALLDTSGFEAPSAVAVVSPLHLDAREIVFPASYERSFSPSLLPAISPPVFLLTGSLLI